MHLAILMTNTDEGDFAQQHPKDGEKFTDLLKSVRADWEITSFDVKDGVFPETLIGFDGLVITGSPASVRDGAPWIEELMTLIKEAYLNGLPMFGACFGHQAIAAALGGTIDYNPKGWVFGLTEASVVKKTPWTQALPATLRQYAAHKEQVVDLPNGCEIVTSSPQCPIGGFVIGAQVYTTQNHPEMTADFIEALIANFADDIGKEVAQGAKASLTQRADNGLYAQTIARFFEHAKSEMQGPLLR